MSSQIEDFMLNNFPKFTAEKNEIVLFDETGNVPTGPVVARSHKTGQIYVGGMQAEITNVSCPQSVILAKSR